MHKHTQTKVFAFTPIDPPEYLLTQIESQITFLKQRAARIRFALFSGTTLVSLITTIVAFRYTWGSFAQSSFSAYASLLSSDSSAILLYWKEFAFSLIESLPIMSIIILLATVFTLLLSLKLTLRYLKTAYNTSPFTQFA